MLLITATHSQKYIAWLCTPAHVESGAATVLAFVCFSTCREQVWEEVRSCMKCCAPIPGSARLNVLRRVFTFDRSMKRSLARHSSKVVASGCSRYLPSYCPNPCQAPYQATYVCCPDMRTPASVVNKAGWGHWWRCWHSRGLARKRRRPRLPRSSSTRCSALMCLLLAMSFAAQVAWLLCAP